MFMKIRVLIILALLALCWIVSVAARAQDSAPPAQPQPQPAVVVELFTSEGCSDCPPADDLLNAIARQSSSGKLNIIPLAFHVTYWDQYGWHDRFDDNRYTERQQNYQTQFHTPSIYTPQSVIDGRYEAVGNSRVKVLGLLQRAANDPKPVSVELTVNGDSLAVTTHASGKASGKVLLAITQDDLSTEVKAGENKSKTLHHDAVVRSLETLGKLKDGEFSKTVSLKLKNDWVRDKLHAIVLVQDNDDHILGAGTTVLSSASTAALNR